MRFALPHQNVRCSCVMRFEEQTCPLSFFCCEYAFFFFLLHIYIQLQQCRHHSTSSSKCAWKETDVMCSRGKDMLRGRFIRRSFSSISDRLNWGILLHCSFDGSIEGNTGRGVNVGRLGWCAGFRAPGIHTPQCFCHCPEPAIKGCDVVRLSRISGMRIHPTRYVIVAACLPVCRVDNPHFPLTLA